MTTHETLIAMRELLAVPERWTQGASARSAVPASASWQGVPVLPTSRAACRWCIEGAAMKVTGHGLMGKLGRLLARLIDGDETASVVLWQDTPDRAHAEVLALLDRAIAAATGETE